MAYNDRFAEKEEIINILSQKETEGAGIPLFYDGVAYYVYPKECNTVIIGETGTGKSRRGTVAAAKSVIKAKESGVFVDPKGDFYVNTVDDALRTHRVYVINFRDIFNFIHGWNPLASIVEDYLSGAPERKHLASESLNELKFSLYPDDVKDPFWPDSAGDVFEGAVYALMDVAKPEQVTIQNVYKLIIQGEKRRGGRTYIKDFTDMLNPDSIASLLLASYVNTAPETKGGIRSTFLTNLSMFVRSEALMKMLNSNDFRINELDGETPTAIYIIIPDETPIFDSLAGILCSQIIRHYVRIAQSEYDGTLPCRLNIFLEELGNIGGSIPSLPHLMSAGRSRNIRTTLVLQSYSQLETIYGKSKAETILANANVTMAFRTSNWDTLQELSNKCGTKEVLKNNHMTVENLIKPSQIASMEVGQALVIINGRTRFITWVPDFTEMFNCSNKKHPDYNPIPKERKEEVPFSVTDFVDNKNAAKMAEVLPHPFLAGNSEPIEIFMNDSDG